MRTQIEQLAAQQAQFSDQADFATMSLQILGPQASVDAEPKPEPSWSTASGAPVRGTLAVFGGMIVLLGYVVPAGILAAIGYGLWRLVNRRRRQGPTPADVAVA